MTDLSHIEAELLRCAEVAMSKGLALITGAWTERLEPGFSSKECGVCLLRAHELFGGPGRACFSDAMKVSIAGGWDDSATQGYMSLGYHDLGARLRANLNPRPARQ